MNYLTRHDSLDDFFRGFFVRPVAMESTTTEAAPVKIDVREQEDQYYVQAELPGVKREDIQIHVDGATVSLTAERHQEKELREGERVLRVERHFGKLSRTFQLGQDIDEDRASAKFADGVLQLTLPKKIAAQAKRITIQ